MLGGIHSALLAVPIVASLGVLLVTFAWLGPWVCVPVMVWLLAAALLCTAAGERVFLRTGRAARSLSQNERTLLGPVAGGALSRCGFGWDRVDWYIRRRETSVNAYAAGRRSIAVSRGLLDALAAGSLAPERARAILLHEIGHLEDPRARRPPDCRLADWSMARSSKRFWCTWLVGS